MNDTQVTTKYPILLVHGLFGFDRIGQFDMFHGIAQALERSGCRVHVPALSGVHDNETRGEQLLEQIERFLKRTGYLKVNLVGHSQGALTSRYAAAVRPDRIASVTSVSGPNHGSEMADRVRRAFTPGELPERVASRVIAGFGHFLAMLGGNPLLPQAPLLALDALTSEGVARFNRDYPQGLPQTWGGEGAERVDGVHYYSWVAASRALWQARGKTRLTHYTWHCAVIHCFSSEKPLSMTALWGVSALIWGKSSAPTTRWTMSMRSTRLQVWCAKASIR